MKKLARRHALALILIATGTAGRASSTDSAPNLKLKDLSGQAQNLNSAHTAHCTFQSPDSFFRADRGALWYAASDHDPRITTARPSVNSV
jgi:hypothetical protein